MTQPSPRGPDASVPFLVTVFALTGLLLLPAGLAQRGAIAGPPERWVPLAILGFWSPMLAALLVARFARGGGGARDLFRPLGKWRVGAGWFLLAFSLPAVVCAAGMAGYRVLTGTTAGDLISLPHDGQRLAAMIMLPLVDQIGWRGFAYPRLAGRYGALAGSLILGVLWGLWHTTKQIIFNEGAASIPPPFMMLYFVAVTLVFTWIYQHTGGSLLLVVVAQMGAYLTDPNAPALPGRPSPLAIQTVAFVLLAIALVVLDRNVWRHGRRPPASAAPSPV